MRSTSTLLAASLAAGATALSVPANVQNLYNSLKSKGSCSNKLASGFWSRDDSGSSYSYCGDHITSDGIVYLQGTGGKFVNMDIDCDGYQHGPGNDGRCGNSDDTQSVTSFADTVRGYNKGVTDLNAYVHSYVVFGNEGSKSGWATFDPQSVGIEPLSVMAVVCGNKMFYGVWGDSNGDDGSHPVVGEASISLATACYGSGITGNNGHDEDDVLYIGFRGKNAVPGANGAKWNAQSFTEFHNSITSLGNSLVAGIGNGGTTTPPPSGGCSWEGHCAGASCSSADDCSDDLTCNNGVCGTGGSAAPAPTCSWTGHCAGASCTTGDDCSDSLTCKSGKCA